jgi:hypothetical protein
LVANPRGDLASFVNAILIAEGIHPVLAHKEVKGCVTEAVRDWIFDDGRGRGTAFGLPLTPPA